MKRKINPIARFEPTEQGWNLAIKFLEIISGDIE